MKTSIRVNSKGHAARFWGSKPLELGEVFLGTVTVDGMTTGALIRRLDGTYVLGYNGETTVLPHTQVTASLAAAEIGRRGGRKGGKSTSKAKSAASRKNGLLGGDPWVNKRKIIGVD